MSQAVFTDPVSQSNRYLGFLQLSGSCNIVKLIINKLIEEAILNWRDLFSQRSEIL